MVEVGLIKLLASEVSLSALQADRVTPIVRDINGSLPATTIFVVGGESEPTFETSGMTRMRVQVDFWGGSYAEASALRHATVQFLNGWYGELPDGSYIQNIDLIQKSDGFEQESRLFRLMAEFYLFFTTPA
ncbi:MAG TPA: hypothetical protein VGE93_08595 [Bryobacteraceae bacterium]